MIQTNPKVSICLTTYNRDKELILTIKSILNQSFTDFELIISDDCSTDETELICKEFEKKDSRIRYFRNEYNLRMPKNLNSAISKSKGLYIANLHDGDIYRSDLIEKWYYSLENNPNAAFVFNDYNSSKSTFGKNDYGISPITLGYGQFEIAKHYLKTLTCCVWGTVMARRETYNKYGPFNEKYGFISDVEMWLRICSKEQFAYINEHLIDLVPREKTHRYYLPDWQHKFWDFLILKKTIKMYETQLANETRDTRKKFNFILIREYYKAMIILLKHKDFKRVKEGLSIWKDSPYLLLRLWTFIFKFNTYPDWYIKENYWDELNILDKL